MFSQETRPLIQGDGTGILPADIIEDEEVDKEVFLDKLKSPQEFLVALKDVGMY